MKKLISLILILCFSPVMPIYAENSITRAEFIAYIVDDLGLLDFKKPPEFDDLSADDTFYEYIASAIEYGIINGYGNNTVRPHSPLTREDAVVMLSRAYKFDDEQAMNIKGFSDYDEISNYSVKHIVLAIQNGIIKYTRGSAFRPKEEISVSESKELAYKFKSSSKIKFDFSVGYPRQSQKKEYGALSIDIRTTKPSTVYYKLSPANGLLSGFKPDKSEINTFLTSVSISNTTVNLNIYPDELKSYNIYLIAKSGEETSNIATISNVTPHLYNYGDGTEENPYLIYTQEQLKNISYYHNKSFRLENDITLSENFKSISFDEYIGFSGTLDGNFHKITGLKINNHEKNAGLFSSIYGAKIKNLYVDADICANSNVGIIAGISEGSKISQCMVSGQVKATNNNAGGICGINNGEIINCISAAYTVTSTNYSGGVCGTNKGDIKNTLSAVYSVSSDMYASAIAGANIGGKIDNNVCASLYADDVLTAKTGRVTTNKQYGTTNNNYCYDKMISDTDVVFGSDTQDGLELSWNDLISPSFYRENLNWDTQSVWTDFTDEDFRLPSLRGFNGNELIKGLTIYAPEKIYNESELRTIGKHPDSNYILMNDISLNIDKDWEMIDAEEGFCGSLDGNGYTISKMHISLIDGVQSYGMFKKIGSGTVRNLNLSAVSIDGNTLIGGITAENHGYIENCSVSGKIYALNKNTTLSCGGVCGNNYGFIENVSSSVKIRADGHDVTLGGIAANNEGSVFASQYIGSIQSEEQQKSSDSIIGGICGINTSGYVYNCFSEPDITSKSEKNYSGGAVGIIYSGEIYKVASCGNIHLSSENLTNSSAYAGGITGLSSEGLIMNCIAANDIYSYAINSYSGGISGYNELSSIQNCYAKGSLSANGLADDSSEIYAGGICAVSDGGFILDNVSIKKNISSDGFVDYICSPRDEMTTCNNNYARKDTVLFGTRSDVSSNAELMLFSKILSPEFFFKPIFEGGKLGWSTDDVWYGEQFYSLPLLTGVPAIEKLKQLDW